jgi:hypothetical protein
VHCVPACGARVCQVVPPSQGASPAAGRGGGETTLAVGPATRLGQLHVVTRCTYSWLSQVPPELRVVHRLQYWQQSGHGGQSGMQKSFMAR